MILHQGFGMGRLARDPSLVGDTYKRLDQPALADRIESVANLLEAERVIEVEPDRGIEPACADQRG